MKMFAKLRNAALVFLTLLLAGGCQAGKCGNDLCVVRETVSSCSKDCKLLIADPSRIILIDRTGTGPRGVPLNTGILILGYVQNGTEKSTLTVQRYSSHDFRALDKTDVIERPGRSGYNLGNPTPFQTKSGRLILGYRDHLPEGASKRFRLRIAFSDDYGKTWEVREAGTSGLIDEGDRGIWEPYFYYDKHDVLRVVYAKEQREHGCGNRKGNRQVIVMKSSHDNGLTWQDETAIVGEGVSRDGVPVVTRLGDGSYLLVFESWRKSGCGDSIPSLVIRSVQSRDGIKWGKRRIVYQPQAAKEGSSRGFDYPKASWPAVATLADGRVLVAFTTDEDFPDADGRYGKKDDKHMNERLLLSKGGPSYETLEWDYSSLTTVTPQDEWQSPNARFSSLTMNKYKGSPILLMGLPPRALAIDMAR